jgi:hypothetical protein
MVLAEGNALENRTAVVYRYEYLDSRTLVWTRSEAFAIADTIRRWHAVSVTETAQAVPADRVAPTGIFLDGPQPPALFVDALIDSVS